MLKIDYHIHTNYSFDSRTTMENMIKRAISLNLDEIAITDHADFIFGSADFLKSINYTQYIREFNELKNKYADKIRVIFGIEVGLCAKNNKNINAFLRSQPFEFVIGSLHDYNGMDFYYPEFYEGKTKKQAYTQYFQEIIATVKAIPDFNVYGHMDYIERYGRYDDKTIKYSDFSEIIDEMLKVIIEYGKGIEINTSGFRYKLGHCHPQLEIIKRYKQLGGEIITVGSDAHRPEDIYLNFKDAYDNLTDAGFKAVTVFRDKKPIMVDI